MPGATARAALRPSRHLLTRAPLRNASTTSEAANAASSGATKAKDSASQATSKASQGLTRVTSSAGSTLSKAGGAVQSTLGKIGGRTGRLIGFVQSMIPPTVYYSKVGWELTKMTFQNQKMSPPRREQLQSLYERMLHTMRNPSSLTSQNPGLLNPQQAMNSIRNINRQQMGTAAVITAEVVGFFTVGEMLGKRQVVGYPGAVGHRHVGGA